MFGSQTSSWLALYKAPPRLILIAVPACAEAWKAVMVAAAAASHVCGVDITGGLVTLLRGLGNG